jgi:serine/threonine-protein kinase
MSEVFLALMSAACGSAKPVVIKRLWPELTQLPDYVQLFLDEARLSLQMRHPNVIHAYESGQDGTRHYLTLEYLDGQSLKHVLGAVAANGGMSLPLALKVICDVLAALEYTHDLQDLSGRPLRIVHRDVSPQNVFVTYEGLVKLVDFGIAQSVSTHASQPARSLKGRIAYMAPEQVAGEAVDRRADLFPVGVMLWEMAVGARMWQGMTDAAISQHLLDRKPMPLLPRTRGFPPGLAAICARALAPEPEHRYPDASTFLSDLAELMTGSAPVQARLLGDLMGRLFGSTRALTRAMLQQRLRGEGLFPGDEPAHASSDRPATGEYPTSAASSSKMESVFDRSMSSSIATAGEEVTGVHSVPRAKPTKRVVAIRTVAAAVLVLAVLALGIALGARLLRPARPAQHASAAVVPAVLSAPAQSEKPTLVESPERSAEAPREGTGPTIEVAKVAQEKRMGIPKKYGKPARKAGAVSHTTPGMSASGADAFDVDLKTVRRAPGRIIDREDPYRP